MCFLSQWPFFSVDASDLNVALLSGMIPWNQDYRKFLLKTFSNSRSFFDGKDPECFRNQKHTYQTFRLCATI